MSTINMKSMTVIDDIPTVIIEKPEENWIWVTGYKGTDKDMKCKNDYQFEIGKVFEMPEDADIHTCYSGFHLCLDLDDVFGYYSIGNGNRFFEVRALVREKDVRNYSKNKTNYIVWGTTQDKLAAKSIELVRELTTDEILERMPEVDKWSEELKLMAIEESFIKAQREYRIGVLTCMGYARPLAEYIINHADGSGYTLAVALDSQPDISMDTKINAIFSHV